MLHLIYVAILIRYVAIQNLNQISDDIVKVITYYDSSF